MNKSVTRVTARPGRWWSRGRVDRSTLAFRCIELAISQRGVISAAQAIACGMSMSAIQRRVRTGRWIVVHPGVYRLHEYPPSWQQALVAACIWAGPGAVASHRAAAQLWKLGPERAPIEIIAPRSTRGPKPLVIHRTDSLEAVDLTSVEGVPTTTATRTLVDLGAVVSLHVVDRALEAALRQGLTSLQHVADRLEDLGRPGRRGVAKLRRALRERDPRLAPTESELESLLWQLILDATLPPPERQYEIYDDAGLIGRVDFCYPAELLVIEAIGLSWHSGDRVVHDGVRRNRLVLAGWRVLEFPWRDVVRRRRAVAQQIKAALSATVVAFRPQMSKERG